MIEDPAQRPHAGLAARLAADRSGASGVITGVLITVVLGFIGLGVDLGTWYGVRRSAQNAADSAAFSGAVSLMGATGAAAGQARAVAARYGFIHGVDGVSVTVNEPPVSGSHVGNDRAVEVVVEQPARRFFSGLLASGSERIRARAVGVVVTAGKVCVLALNATASASALETGSANVNLAGCSLFANSTSQAAFELKGAASFRAESIGLVGGYAVSNNASLTTTSGVHTGQLALEDPYRNVPIPAYSGCTYNGASLTSGTYGGGGAPTVFCNGLRINSGATVTLNPGVYIIDRGALQVNGGATLRGAGVTIVLTSSTGSDYATVQINGSSMVELSAPTSGPTAGLIFYQDRRAPSGVNNIFNGGSTQVMTGALYFPKQTVTFTGGAQARTSGCTQLLASEVAFRGDSTLALECEGTGVRMAGGTAALVE